MSRELIELLIVTGGTVAVFLCCCEIHALLELMAFQESERSSEDVGTETKKG